MSHINETNTAAHDFLRSVKELTVAKTQLMHFQEELATNRTRLDGEIAAAIAARDQADQDEAQTRVAESSENQIWCLAAQRREAAKATVAQQEQLVFETAASEPVERSEQAGTITLCWPSQESAVLAAVEQLCQYEQLCTLATSEAEVALQNFLTANLAHIEAARKRNDAARRAGRAKDALRSREARNALQQKTVERLTQTVAEQLATLKELVKAHPTSN